MPAEVADNLLQVALGCLTHHRIIHPSAPLEDSSSLQAGWLPARPPDRPPPHARPAHGTALCRPRAASSRTGAIM